MHYLRKISFKMFSLVFLIVFLSATIMAMPVSAFVSQNSTSWFWTSDTNISAMATGDVNNDGKTEIVTAGYYNDGLRWNAQLVVWNASNLAVEKVFSWYWTENTQISSIAIGDVNGDGKNEIVTGGEYFDGYWNAQLIVWNGSNLALESNTGWRWTGDTEISSVAVANITGGLGLDIVTGGAYFDGVRYNAQLAIWNGSTLALENVKGWVWGTNTIINSVAVGDVLGNGAKSIVTGGQYSDGTNWNAQLCVWNAQTLTLNNVKGWLWTSDTEINSVALANVTGGHTLSVVVGGDYNDNTRINAQLSVWNASTLSLQNIFAGFTTSSTKINSIVVGNYSGGTSLDIISAGSFNDLTRSNAQLTDWNGTTLTVISTKSWFTTSDTGANSVAIGNFGAGNRVVVGGSYFDNIRSNAQITIWG
jgi:hypothetical protein